MSMDDRQVRVIGGVDCHSKTHHAVALDQYGRRLDDRQFRATAAGYGQLVAWLHGFGSVEAVGVESTSSYGAGLTRALLGAGMRVCEVNQPHRHVRARRGKSDVVDAEAAARKVLSGEATAMPKDTTGIVEAIRQLRLVRSSAVKSRTAACTQLRSVLTTAPTPLREQLTPLSTTALLHTCAGLRPTPGRLAEPREAAKEALRTLSLRIGTLDAEIKRLDKRLATLVTQAAPRTSARFGVGIQVTAQLLVSAGQNVHRLTSEAAFAHLCAAAPIPASSGQTHRHRLNPYGDRHANAALHIVTTVRLRHCERTRAYAARRTAQGLSKRDIQRCLKRYVARELFHTLIADLAALARP
jgi:transposase